MLTAIITGQRDPKVFAQMGRTRMRGRIRQLKEALDCSSFTGASRCVIGRACGRC